MEISFHDLHRSPAEVLRVFPKPSTPAARVGSGLGESRDREEYFVRLLERLARSEPIRIDCGGSGCEGGIAWCPAPPWRSIRSRSS